MREIKFRGYRIDTDEMYDWDDIRYEHEFYEETDIWKVMQYVGLKDKNGVEIYEGDIVRCEHSEGEEICEVGFEDGKFGLVNGDDVDFCNFWVYVGDGTWKKHPLYKNPLYEVIGNIYENPELLEVKDDK